MIISTWRIINTNVVTIILPGLPNRFLAFERFLELHPEYIEKVLLLQVAVPSRTDVKEYNGIIFYSVLTNFNVAVVYALP